MRTLGLDLDGVLYEWHKSIYDFFTRYKGYTGTLNEFWQIECLKFDEDFWNYIIEVDIFYSDRSPTKDCEDFINVVKDKFEIYYITARPDYVKTTTEQYLRRHNFPFLDNLIFTHDKVNMARKLQLSYMLEDNIKQIEGLSKVTNAILIAQPYNKEIWDKYPTAHSLMSALQFMEI